MMEGNHMLRIAALAVSVACLTTSAMAQKGDGGTAGGVEQLTSVEVAAGLILREGAHLDAEALEAFLRDRLAAFKVPRHLKGVASLPRTHTGKLRRGVVRDLFSP